VLTLLCNMYVTVGEILASVVYFAVTKNYTFCLLAYLLEKLTNLNEMSVDVG